MHYREVRHSPLYYLLLIIATTQNYTGVYIIMACLQAFVNNLLVWQSSCKSKLRPVNSESISPAIDTII